MSGGIARREFLKAVGGLSLLGLVPPARLAVARRAQFRPGDPGRFLTNHELITLRAVTDRLLPGPPEDPEPGALAAGCAEAIDALLGAFTFRPPLIHAGGPFSNRAGGEHDDLADFVPLDPLAELGWRIRLEGSLGRRDRSFGGPVPGLQEIYRHGLADLDARARPTFGAFVASTPSEQDRLLQDPAISDFTVAVLSDTVAAMYGVPEYGGNRDLVGWRGIDWPGDVQPQGYTDRQVTLPDAETGTPMGPTVARAALQRFLVGIEDLT